MKSGGFIEYFSQPKFIVGNRAMEHISVELDSYNAKRPMVLTSAVSAPLVKHLIKALYESNVVIAALYDQIPAGGARLEIIERLSGLYQWRECDSIIAVGGSSVMDTARCLNLSVSEGFDFRKGVDKISINGHLRPLIYIAASVYDGFECSDTARFEGRPFTSEYLYPDIVCVDRRMAAPRKETASFVYAAMDSLTACIEGSGETDDNPLLDSSAYAGIGLIAGNIIKSAKKPCDKKSAVAVANGIAMSGSARSNSKSGPVMTLAGILAEETGYSSGMLSALLLPGALSLRLKKKMFFRDELLLALEGIDRFCTVPSKERAREAVKAVEAIISSLQAYIPRSLKELNIQEHLIEKAVTRAVESGDKKFNRDFYAQMISAAREGVKGGGK